MYSKGWINKPKKCLNFFYLEVTNARETVDEHIDMKMSAYD